MWILLFLMGGSIGPLSAQVDSSQLSPAEIIDKVDQMLRGDSSQGRVEMVVVTRRWKRNVTMEIWSEGTEKALIRVLQPKKRGRDGNPEGWLRHLELSSQDRSHHPRSHLHDDGFLDGLTFHQ